MGLLRSTSSETTTAESTSGSVSALHTQARQDYQQGQGQREDAVTGAANAHCHAIEAADAWRGESRGAQ